MIYLGPSIIDASTTNCDESIVRLNGQDTMIIKLNKRVNELSHELINNQIDYTNKMVAKQTETMLYIDSIIKEFELVNKIEKRTNQMVVKKHSTPTYNDSVMRDQVVVESNSVVIEKSHNQFVVDRLKTLRKKLKKDIKNQ